MPPIKLYAWHFMSYPYLPDDFDERFESCWITVPNTLCERDKVPGLYQENLGQLAYADELGFDGVVLNEHHQSPYALMPSPLILAAALTQITKRCKIVALGPLLPLQMNPLRVAEEYAMLDNMSDGRIIAGFAAGGGAEHFNYNISATRSRDQFWEAVDLIQRAWTEDGPFIHEGKYYPLRYVNPWPKPHQDPHPEIWIPSSPRPASMAEVAKRGYCCFLAVREHGSATKKARIEYARIIEGLGRSYDPSRLGVLTIAYVSDSDDHARAEAKDAVWYFLRNIQKGHHRREGRQILTGPGNPRYRREEWRKFLLHGPKPGGKMMGDAETWEEVEASNAIILGGPETVRRKLLELIELSEAGHLLVQFHFGNLSPELTRNSMKLFAEEIAPALREESGKLFAEKYPAWSERESIGVAG